MDFEEELIQKIKENDFFYDKSSKNYKNIALKTRKWKEIAGELNIPVDKAKKRWRTIKDRYYRTNKDKKSYRFASELSFLDNCKSVNKKTTSEYSEIDCDDLETVENVFVTLLQDSEEMFSKASTSRESCNTTEIKEADDDPLIRNTSQELGQVVQQVVNKPEGKTKEEYFCNSLAIQLMEAQLPSDRFRALQIKYLQILDEEIKGMERMKE